MTNVLDTKYASTERRMVAELHDQGKTPREIAAALKVSTQRVYQQLAKLGVKANRADARRAS